MEILAKYAPTTLQEVVGNKIQIKRITDTLKNVGNEQKILGIQGPNGCGKSLFCNLIFKYLNFNVLEVNEAKDISIQISIFCLHKTIDAFFRPQRKVIFIDNLETLIGQDKHVIASIMTCVPLVKAKQLFIIFTCKPNEDKKLTDFKKEADVIKINYPSVKDTFVYLLDIITEKEKLPNVSDERLLKLVNQHRGCIRDVVLSLQNSNESAEDIKRSNLFKDMNSFEIVRKILMSSNLCMDDIDGILNDDPGTVGFVLYENIPDELHNNYEILGMSFIDVLININQCFVDSCIIEDFVFKHTEWTLFQLIHLMRIAKSITEINNLKKKKSYKDTKYRFSQLLSKLSHKNIMSKKMKTSNDFDIEERLEIVDKITRLHVNSKLRKVLPGMTLDTNFINTYEKYFIEEDVKAT